MTNDHPTLPEVIGQNLKRLRGDHTMDELATAGRRIGAKWSSGSIGAMETGAFKPTIETLAALALALDRLNGEPMKGKTTISELIETDGQIELAGIVTNSAALAKFLSGSPSGAVIDWNYVNADVRNQVLDYTDRLANLNLPDMDIEEAIAALDGPPSTTEDRLAKRSNLAVEELRAWSQHLWRMTIEKKRDEEAGPGATPQKKGRVTRELLDQIHEAMGNGDR